MISLETFLLFSLASLVLLITPGPAVIYIVARSVSQGTPAGIVAVLGMHVGTMVHVAAAAFGLSQILLTSSLAFSLVKYLGAAYLIYLGIKSFIGKEEPVGGGKVVRKNLLVVFRESVVVNVLNPKTALFFFAFLPQFVDTSQDASVSTQFIVLGSIFIVIGTVSDGLYAFFAGALREKLRRVGTRFGRYASGGVYTGLGLLTAAVEAKA